MRRFWLKKEGNYWVASETEITDAVSYLEETPVLRKLQTLEEVIKDFETQKKILSAFGEELKRKVQAIEAELRGEDEWGIMQLDLIDFDETIN
jgi:hypothetical protein